MSFLVEEEQEYEIDYEPIEPVPQIAAKFEYTKGARNIASGTADDVAAGGERKRPRLSPEERPRETDERRLAGRQKQIDYGKNTKGYENYLALIPKKHRTKEHPRTPDKTQVCSKRSWDGQISKWRRQLHAFDDPQ